VMEFVPGEDLCHLLKRDGRLDAARMSALMHGICGGVEIAHQAGIFHRDLKPENILLPEGGTGPKVVDFGVAKLTKTAAGDGGTMSVVGTIVGTPAYMSPEQLRGEAVDARADVFSLGVMAYEMLTARLPYTGGSLFDIGMKQVEGRVDMSGVPAELADVIGRAIAYDKTARPDTALAFSQALRLQLKA
jgi:eukaryotic-like serine/threonine-protein kinase